MGRSMDEPAISAALDAIERIVGYRFVDTALLEAALTHPSATEGVSARNNYERLEFLGDAVLSLVIVETVFLRFPQMPEGDMTKLKIGLVAGTTQAQIAEEIGLGEMILFGDSVKGPADRGRASALENAFEALIGAIYVDGGLATTREVVSRAYGDRIRFDFRAISEHPKSELQELAQASGLAPEYSIVETSGPPHDATFTAQVSIDGTVLGQGVGRSKKEAEMAAAAQALEVYKTK